MVLHILVRKNHVEKLLVSIKCCNLSFKKGVILLCQSILETRQTQHLCGSALFIIPLKVTSTKKRKLPKIVVYGAIQEFFYINEKSYSVIIIILSIRVGRKKYLWIFFWIVNHIVIKTWLLFLDIVFGNIFRKYFALFGGLDSKSRPFLIY